MADTVPFVCSKQARNSAEQRRATSQAKRCWNMSRAALFFMGNIMLENLALESCFRKLFPKCLWSFKFFTSGMTCCAPQQAWLSPLEVRILTLVSAASCWKHSAAARSSSPIESCGCRFAVHFPLCSGQVTVFPLALSSWAVLHSLLPVYTLMTFLAGVTFSHTVYTTCVAGWKGVLPAPEYRGLCYLASPSTGMGVLAV